MNSTATPDRIVSVRELMDRSGPKPANNLPASQSRRHPATTSNFTRPSRLVGKRSTSVAGEPRNAHRLPQRRNADGGNLEGIIEWQSNSCGSADPALSSRRRGKLMRFKQTPSKMKF